MEDIKYRRVYAKIDLDAVEHNIIALKNHTKESTQIYGVVKADGYGHGAIPIAETIDEYVGGYGVATIEEAMQLRSHGVKKDILVMGVTPIPSYEEAIANHITITIFTKEQATLLSEVAKGKRVQQPVHLKIDTGMNRIGISASESGIVLAKEICGLEGLHVVGIFTHFSKADEPDDTYSHMQMDKFNWVIQELKKAGISIPYQHVANSAATMLFPEYHFDYVRPGIAIYGLYPVEEMQTCEVKLKPVLELKTKVSYVKWVEEGSQISYGGTYITTIPQKIATIPVGYADGYPRNLSNKGYVLIKGKRAKILGKVCMDQCMVDVTDIPDVEIGEDVTLIGRDGEEVISVELLCSLFGGFHYELVCDIGKRVPRMYLKNGKVRGYKDYFDDRYVDFSL